METKEIVDTVANNLDSKRLLKEYQRGGLPACVERLMDEAQDEIESLIEDNVTPIRVFNHTTQYWPPGLRVELAQREVELSDLSHYTSELENIAQSEGLSDHDLPVRELPEGIDVTSSENKLVSAIYINELVEEFPVDQFNSASNYGSVQNSLEHGVDVERAIQRGQYHMAFTDGLIDSLDSLDEWPDDMDPTVPESDMCIRCGERLYSVFMDGKRKMVSASGEYHASPFTTDGPLMKERRAQGNSLCNICFHDMARDEVITDSHFTTAGVNQFTLSRRMAFDAGYFSDEIDELPTESVGHLRDRYFSPDIGGRGGEIEISSGDPPGYDSPSPDVQAIIALSKDIDFLREHPVLVGYSRRENSAARVIMPSSDTETIKAVKNRLAGDTEATHV